MHENASLKIFDNSSLNFSMNIHSRFSRIVSLFDTNEKSSKFFIFSNKCSSILIYQYLILNFRNLRTIFLNFWYIFRLNCRRTIDVFPSPIFIKIVRIESGRTKILKQWPHADLFSFVPNEYNGEKKKYSDREKIAMARCKTNLHFFTLGESILQGLN